MLDLNTLLVLQSLNELFPVLGVVANDIKAFQKLLIVEIMIVFDGIANVEDDRLSHFASYCD